MRKPLPGMFEQMIAARELTFLAVSADAEKKLRERLGAAGRVYGLRWGDPPAVVPLVVVPFLPAEREVTGFGKAVLDGVAMTCSVHPNAVEKVPALYEEIPANMEFLRDAFEADAFQAVLYRSSLVAAIIVDPLARLN